MGDEENSEYSVDSNDPVTPAPSIPEPTAAPAAAPFSARPSSAGPSPPPPSGFSPEGIKTAIESNPVAVEAAQAVLFFRRPVASLALLICANVHFWFYARHLRSLYPFLAFLALYGLLLRRLAPAIVPLLRETLFRGEISKGDATELNRIRPASDIAGPVKFAVSFVWIVPSLVFALIEDESPGGLVRRAAFYLVLYILTNWLNLFRWVVILTNVVLIVPGLWLHPRVREGVATFTEKVRSIGRKTKAE
jgi:hypothetical protein